jgi:hypothetical protein
MLTGSSLYASENQPSVLATAASTVWSVTWNRTYTASDMHEVDSIVQTSDGGYLLGGTTSPLPGTATNIEVVKVDSSGNIEWNKTYEGIGNHFSKWLIQTSDGNYALAGEYIGASQNEVGFWLAKINLNSDVLWTKTYIGEAFSWAVTLVQTSDGGYALSGSTNARLTTAAGNMDIWLLKTDPLGNQQWAKTVGNGRANSIIQTADQGYALAGYVDSLDYLLIKTNSTGDVQFRKTFGSQDIDSASSVVQTNDEGFALGGSMWLRSNGGGTNLAIVKTDPSGNEQWTKYYGAGSIRGLLQTSDGGFALANNPFVKVDGAGVEQWRLSLGDPSNQVFSVIETEDGGYAVAGSSSSTQSPVTYAWMVKIDSPSTLQNPTPTASIPEFPVWIVTAALIAATTASLVTTKNMAKPEKKTQVCN